MRKVIISCEHGGNSIPAPYQYLFKGKEQLLATHCGWDIGALYIAKKLAKKVGNFFFYTTISRLLVELNRSSHHPRLFSDITRQLSTRDKEKLLQKYYFPYRQKIEQTILQELKNHNSILHVSVHSFTPIFANQVRDLDIGLLYDPSRKKEKEFCEKWKKRIHELDSNYIVKRNKPYLGKSDGLVTYFRKKFPARSYSGIELETNQKFFADKHDGSEITRLLVNSLKDILF